VSVNRGSAVSWAIALGLFAGSVAGSVVPAETGAAELRHIVGFVLVFSPAIYLLIVRRWALWQRKSPSVRFVVFVLSTLVGIGVLTTTVSLVVGPAENAARVVEPLAAIVGFVVAAWVTFDGGAERIWSELLSRMDIEW
jgi:hypothetical protein